MNTATQLKLVNKMARRIENAEQPQGVDFLLFNAFEAATALRAFNKCELKADRILEGALYTGNAYISILNLGMLLDTGKTQKFSLTKIWPKFETYVHEASNSEKELITKHLRHPKDKKYTQKLMKLRNSSFAHNSMTMQQIDSLVIDDALRFCFRIWSLLNSLLTEYPILFPYRVLSCNNRTLKKLLTPSEYQVFEDSWNHSIEVAKSWEVTPLDD